MGSKGRGRRAGAQPSASAMMKQVQELQAQMLQAQQELAQETVQVSAGGGAVTVVVNGQQEVQSVTIDPDAVDPDDVEMLQDLVLAAVNEALTKSRQMAEQKMAPLTGALDVPGLF